MKKPTNIRKAVSRFKDVLSGKQTKRLKNAFAQAYLREKRKITITAKLKEGRKLSKLEIGEIENRLTVKQKKLEKRIKILETRLRNEMKKKFANFTSLSKEKQAKLLSWVGKENPKLIQEYKLLNKEINKINDALQIVEKKIA